MSNLPNPRKEPTVPEVDIYRDTFIRYMGYTNEVGEAFRPLVPSSIVSASYGIALGYVFLDAYDKGRKSYMDGANERQVAIATTDVFLWQILASVCIPGFTINRITWLSRHLVNKRKLPNILNKTLPTALGLAAIPFIVHPIDSLVDNIMDRTYRKWVPKMQ